MFVKCANDDIFGLNLNDDPIFWSTHTSFEVMFAVSIDFLFTKSSVPMMIILGWTINDDPFFWGTNTFCKYFARSFCRTLTFCMSFIVSFFLNFFLTFFWYHSKSNINLFLICWSKYKKMISNPDVNIKKRSILISPFFDILNGSFVFPVAVFDEYYINIKIFRWRNCE